LVFTGAVAPSAADPSTWQLTINGQSVPVEKALIEGGSAVRLLLPADALRSGDELLLTWPTLRDAQGRIIGGQWNGIVR
jgi:hypothetical protein